MHLVRAFPATQGVGGPVNWYKLTPEGYRYLHGTDTDTPHRTRFEPMPPSRFHHTQSPRRDHRSYPGRGAPRADCGCTILRRRRTGHRRRMGTCKYPDCYFQLEQAGRQFNLMLEVDQATEPLDSVSAHAVREKLLVYEAHQDDVWQWWKQQGRNQHRPYFRVVFLTTSAERRIAHPVAGPRMCCATRIGISVMPHPSTTFLGTTNALTSPLFQRPPRPMAVACQSASELAVRSHAGPPVPASGNPRHPLILSPPLPRSVEGSMRVSRRVPSPDNGRGKEPTT